MKGKLRNRELNSRPRVVVILFNIQVCFMYASRSYSKSSPCFFECLHQFILLLTSIWMYIIYYEIHYSEKNKISIQFYTFFWLNANCLCASMHFSTLKFTLTSFNFHPHIFFFLLTALLSLLLLLFNVYPYIYGWLKDLTMWAYCIPDAAKPDYDPKALVKRMIKWR